MVSSTAAPSYCVLRKTALLDLSFLRCKLEVVVPSSWLIVKARSQAEHPCYLLSGQEMLPRCLCWGGCHSFKHHLSVLAAPTSCYRRWQMYPMFVPRRRSPTNTPALWCWWVDLYSCRIEGHFGVAMQCWCLDLWGNSECLIWQIRILTLASTNCFPIWHYCVGLIQKESKRS